PKRLVREVLYQSDLEAQFDRSLKEAGDDVSALRELQKWCKENGLEQESRRCEFLARLHVTQLHDKNKLAELRRFAKQHTLEREWVKALPQIYRARLSMAAEDHVALYDLSGWCIQNGLSEEAVACRRMALEREFAFKVSEVAGNAEKLDELGRWFGKTRKSQELADKCYDLSYAARKKGATSPETWWDLVKWCAGPAGRRGLPAVEEEAARAVSAFASAKNIKA
ncbi:unnamed protein product, partial [marine sediment metagenome]